MKKDYFLLLTLLTTTVCFVCSFARALASDDYEKTVFDVTFKNTSPDIGESTSRLVSDGKGHLRSETHSALVGNSVTIFDYLNEKEFTMRESDHSVTTTPFHPFPHKGKGSNKPAGNPIGVKVIAGHPCHGYEIKSEYGNCQSWMGDDIHYLVESETALPNGKMTQTLKSWSTATPSPELFKVPSDYKEKESPQ